MLLCTSSAACDNQLIFYYVGPVDVFSPVYRPNMFVHCASMLYMPDPDADDGGGYEWL